LAKRNRTPAGRPTADELELRKERILSVATKLFLKHGYSDTHVSDIARQSGVTLRTVYKYFGDKSEVFTAIVRTNVKGQEVNFEAVTDGQSLHDALMNVAHYSWEMLFDQSTIPLLRVIISENKRFPSLMQSITQFIKKFSREKIIAAFGALGALGEIPDRDHEESALIFMDLILGLTPLRLIMDREAKFPDKEQIKKRVELFVLGRFGPEIASSAHRPRSAVIGRL
jgi:TetR/AcrR family transcriptional regulator, mexJK operon transcriptional repressor